MFPKDYCVRIQTTHTVESFYYWNTLIFGIAIEFVSQLEVYYKLDRLLIVLSSQQSSISVRCYSNKTTLHILEFLILFFLEYYDFKSLNFTNSIVISDRAASVPLIPISTQIKVYMSGLHCHKL